MRGTMTSLPLLAAVLAGCVATATPRQGAYAALADYDAMLAAADAYLCANAGDFSSPCKPKPDCAAGASAPAQGCVQGSVRQAIKAAVMAGGPYVTLVRTLAADDPQEGADEQQLSKATQLLAGCSQRIQEQLLTVAAASSSSQQEP